MGKLQSELRSELAKYRLATGLTQEQLAQIVKVSRQTIIAVEGGTYSPSTVLALRLSAFLGVSVNELFLLPEVVQTELQQKRQQLQIDNEKYIS